MNLITLASALVFLASNSHAGDRQDLPECPKWEKECEPPAPEKGFCDGIFEGAYWGSPGVVSLEIQETEQAGQLRVTGYWQGGVWQAMGICRKFSPFQAAIEMYFPGYPVHRGIVSSQGGSFAVLDGRIDDGTPFRLTRSRR